MEGPFRGSSSRWKSDIKIYVMCEAVHVIEMRQYRIYGQDFLHKAIRRIVL
jgi:tRNA U38,U39,U40 pseudouridine synthase TruA